jgi:hypothetical protein
MRLIALFAIAAAAIAFPSIVSAGEDRRVERIEVPGGIGPARFARMWSTVKAECYDMSYSDIIEEKEIKTIICKQNNLNLFVNFDDTGFVVKADAIFAKMPIIGGLWSSPRNNRKKLIAALKVVQ